MIIVHCTDRHELEGHLRTLAIAWAATEEPDHALPWHIACGWVCAERAAHGAARVRLARAMRLLAG